MLAVEHRLRRRGDFAAVVRAGRRAGRGVLVVHLLARQSSSDPVRVGFVVPRAVGGAVVRNLVRRRLQHLVLDRLAGLWPSADLVVRVSAGAAARSYRQLGNDLDAALLSARSPRRVRPAEAVGRGRLDA